MIVLDTHVLIWTVQGIDRLGAEARDQIEQTDDGIMVPAICAWEAALLEQRGKVRFPGGVAQWLRAVSTQDAFQWTPLTPDIAVDSVTMEWAHRDPADRMIVATARALACPLLTVDRQILAYAAQGHVQAIDAAR